MLMHYIPKDEEEKFNERCIIYELCTVVFEDKMSKKKDGSKFPKELYIKADNIALKAIVERVIKQGRTDEKYTINFFKILLE